MEGAGMGKSEEGREEGMSGPLMFYRPPKIELPTRIIVLPSSMAMV